MEINVTTIHSLPEEIIVRIMSFLDLQELVTTSRTCKAWYRVSKEGVLWRPFVGHLPGISVVSPTRYYRVLSDLVHRDIAIHDRFFQSRLVKIATLDLSLRGKRRVRKEYPASGGRSKSVIYAHDKIFCRAQLMGCGGLLIHNLETSQKLTQPRVNQWRGQAHLELASHGGETRLVGALGQKVTVWDGAGSQLWQEELPHAIKAIAAGGQTEGEPCIALSLKHQSSVHLRHLEDGRTFPKLDTGQSRIKELFYLQGADEPSLLVRTDTGKLKSVIKNTVEKIDTDVEAMQVDLSGHLPRVFVWKHRTGLSLIPLSTGDRPLYVGVQGVSYQALARKVLGAQEIVAIGNTGKDLAWLRARPRASSAGGFAHWSRNRITRGFRQFIDSIHWLPGISKKILIVHVGNQIWACSDRERVERGHTLLDTFKGAPRILEVNTYSHYGKGRIMVEYDGHINVFEVAVHGHKRKRKD